MTVKAVLHRLVVKPVELEEYDEVDAKLKELGFVKAQTEESKYHKTQIDQGIVIDVGPTAFLDYVKKHNLSVPVQVGSKVTYARHSGKNIKDGDDDLVILNDDDILAIHLEE